MFLRFEPKWYIATVICIIITIIIVLITGHLKYLNLCGALTFFAASIRFWRDEESSYIRIPYLVLGILFLLVFFNILK